jgi:ABC-2 type transport system ATP-binding protein
MQDVSASRIGAMLEVTNLTKRFGSKVAVDNLSFSAAAGRILGFLGPNGAGKTTTIRTLLGLAHPSSGSATIDGRPYRALPEPVRAVGAVLEGRQFHPGRSGRNHLRVLATAAGLPKSRVEEVLRLVEPEGAAKRRVKGYSLGMRQRLSLAGALLGEPAALVLDEPANGLDPQGIRWLRDFLRGFAADGRAVLVSSHVLAEVAQTVNEVVVISRGKLVAQGFLDELTRDANAPVRVRSADPGVLRSALQSDGVIADRQPDNWLSVRGVSLEQVGTAALQNQVAVYELFREEQTLEDVFLELTGDTDAGQ